MAPGNMVYLSQGALKLSGGWFRHQIPKKKSCLNRGLVPQWGSGVLKGGGKDLRGNFGRSEKKTLLGGQGKKHSVLKRKTEKGPVNTN